MAFGQVCALARGARVPPPPAEPGPAPVPGGLWPLWAEAADGGKGRGGVAVRKVLSPGLCVTCGPRVPHTSPAKALLLGGRQAGHGEPLDPGVALEAASTRPVPRPSYPGVARCAQPQPAQQTPACRPAKAVRASWPTGVTAS